MPTYRKNSERSIPIMKKSIILVGMPRSGTSMTTNIFAQSGYFVAEDENNQLRQGDEHNPSGYWEAQPLIECNVEILKSTGFKYDNTWLYESIESKQANAIYSLAANSKHKKLVETYNNNAPWIWKDPRLCYTLPYWWPLMNAETTVVLLLKRDPLEIYQSFLRLKWRDHSPEEKTTTLTRISDHLDFATSAIKSLNIPFVEVEYGDYSKRPTKVVKALNQCLGLNLTVQDLGYDANLNHNGFSGMFKIFLNRMIDAVPDQIRKKIKKMIPMALLKALYPHRY